MKGYEPLENQAIIRLKYILGALRHGNIDDSSLNYTLNTFFEEFISNKDNELDIMKNRIDDIYLRDFYNNVVNSPSNIGRYFLSSVLVRNYKGPAPGLIADDLKLECTSKTGNIILSPKDLVTEWQDWLWFFTLDSAIKNEIDQSVRLGDLSPEISLDCWEILSARSKDNGRVIFMNYRCPTQDEYKKITTSIVVAGQQEDQGKEDDVKDLIKEAKINID